MVVINDKHKLKGDLKKILNGKVVILGIGNPLKGDDAVGAELVDRIENLNNLDCIKCEIHPENYTREIISKNPDTLIIVDAVNINGNPGDVVLLESEQLNDECLDAHRIPLSVLIKYLKNYIKDNIYILGIQPKIISYGSNLSKEILESIDVLEKIFLDISKLKN